MCFSVTETGPYVKKIQVNFKSKMFSLVLFVCTISWVQSVPCPCADQSLCDPVQVQYEKEVFGFGQSDYTTYDWDVVTTIAWVNDPKVMCKAHAEKVRVIGTPPNGMPFSPDPAVRSAWIEIAINQTKANFQDGMPRRI